MLPSKHVLVDRLNRCLQERFHSCRSIGPIFRQVLLHIGDELIDDDLCRNFTPVDQSTTVCKRNDANLGANQRNSDCISIQTMPSHLQRLAVLIFEDLRICTC
jgi:hypothetical protein